MDNSSAQTLLEIFLERIRKRLTLTKIMSSPVTFEDVRSESFETMAQTGFIMKLCDDWLKNLPDRVNMWFSIIEEYFTEFAGSWKYYAAAKRLEYIREYGPENSDLDDKGEVRTENLSDSELKPYTILNDLYFYGCRDIIQDFIPEEDTKHFINSIMFDASLDVRQMFRDIAGKDIDTYVLDSEEGEITKESAEDYKLRYNIGLVAAKDEASVFSALTNIIYTMCRKLESMENQMFSDNWEFLKKFSDDCRYIKELRLEETNVWKEHLSIQNERATD